MKTTPILAVTIAAMLLFNGCSTVRHRGTVELFNGKNLAGWQHVLADPNVPREAVWSVKDGVIICKGEPLGAIYTKESFTDFRLIVEYRWAPGATPGNSGVFSRIQTPPKALPRCVEVQLKHGDAGDIMGLQGMKIASGQPRFFEVKNHPVAGDVNGVKKLADLEKPAGKWNRVEVLARDGDYTVWMNGAKVNQASGVEVVAGPVGLQSEGGEVHFRRATLTPL